MKHSAAASLLLSSLAIAVVRARPSHEDGRSISSWSGWAPGTGMSMFASSVGEEDPWALQPPPVWRMGEDGTPRPLERGGPLPPAPGKKEGRRKHHRDQEQEDEDDYSDERGGSRANASFNAWFPILLGSYPERGGEEEAQARGRPSSGQRPQSSRPQGEGVAAIANSVNHGRSGVASSHAVIYSGEPELGQERQHGRRTAASRYYS